MSTVRLRRPLERSVAPSGSDDDGRRNHKSQPKLLGTAHWFGMFAVVALIYAISANIDQAPPAVVPKEVFDKFSEERTRTLLREFTAHGPRPSGSNALEIHATRLIHNHLKQIQSVGQAHHRIEIDEQRPSACLDLTFSASETICYKNVTNILLRIGPKNRESDHALLVNCHFDSVIDAPGATDDAISCVTMIDVLHVISRSDRPLKNDIIFLFNGAEENGMQGAHGFITQHPWRHSVRVAVNLEGAGAGGRELLFQVGPQNAWLINTYLTSVPHPHCNILAQEVFNSGAVPSYTDYQIFRDYGRVPGLDIAYVRNGWLYHTEFDEEKYIMEGAIQRAGENALSLVVALANSPHLHNATIKAEESKEKIVFFDVFGLFAIQYGSILAAVLNYGTIALVLYRIITNLLSTESRETYTFGMLFKAVLVHFVTFISICATGVGIVYGIGLTNRSMAWYATPSLLLPIYFVPMLTVALFVHDLLMQTSKMNRHVAENCHNHASALILTVFLVVLINYQVASAFYIMLLLNTTTLRLVFMKIFSIFGSDRCITTSIYISHILSFIPSLSMLSYAVFLIVELFVPIMGRSGQKSNPEVFLMAVMIISVLIIYQFVSSMQYHSNSIRPLLKNALVLTLIAWLLILFTSVGNPYQDHVNGPRLRRVKFMHTYRQLYDENDKIKANDQSMWIVGLDKRGAGDLPEELTANGKPPNCNNTADIYCDLPYLGPRLGSLKPENSLWLSSPTKEVLTSPIDLQMVSKKIVDENTVTFSFTVKGTDRMSLHITPVNGWLVKEWSLSKTSPLLPDVKSHFVSLATGGSTITPWPFTVTMYNPSNKSTNPKSSKQLYITAVAHYAHGDHQRTRKLKKIRSRIHEMRDRAHENSESWKWAIVPKTMTAEVIGKWF